MGCTDNIISYKGSCNAVAPKSGLYTDQIGLHKKEIEKYISSPYQNADEFFNDQLAIAIKEAQARIYSQFSPMYKPTSIVDSARIGDILDNMQLQTGSSGLLGGIEYKMCNHTSPIEMYVSELSLFVDFTGTVTITVWDIKQNKQIDSFEVDAVAGEVVTVYPYKSYKGNKKELNLLFVYNTSTVDAYTVQIGQQNCSSCNPNSYYRQNPWMQIRGVTVPSSSTKIPSNLTSVNHTSGISMVYSVNCSHEDWICDNVGVLALPIMYKVAENILNYGLNHSDRLNHKTLSELERQKTKESISFFGSNYEEKMTNILNHIKPPIDPICYACNQRIKSVIHEP